MQVGRRKFAYRERHMLMEFTGLRNACDSSHGKWLQIEIHPGGLLMTFDESLFHDWMNIQWLMMISDDSISSDDFYPAGSPVVSALYLFSSRSVSIDPSSLRYVMYARWSNANDTCPAYQRTWRLSNIRNSNWRRPEVVKLFWSPIWGIW